VMGMISTIRCTRWSKIPWIGKSVRTVRANSLRTTESCRSFVMLPVLWWLREDWADRRRQCDDEGYLGVNVMSWIVFPCCGLRRREGCRWADTCHHVPFAQSCSMTMEALTLACVPPMVDARPMPAAEVWLTRVRTSPAAKVTMACPLFCCVPAPEP
jgi:hypothetical protein